MSDSGGPATSPGTPRLSLQPTKVAQFTWDSITFAVTSESYSIGPKEHPGPSSFPWRCDHPQAKAASLLALGCGNNFRSHQHNPLPRSPTLKPSLSSPPCTRRHPPPLHVPPPTTTPPPPSHCPGLPRAPLGLASDTK